MMHFNTNITNTRNKFNIEYEGYDTAKYPIRRIENNMITFDLFDGDNHFENLLNLSKLKMNLFTYQIAEIHKTNYEKINEIEREIFDIPISTNSNKKDLINTHTIITCNNNSTPVNFAINTLPRFSILYPYNQLENYPNKTMSNRETKIKSHLKSIVKMRNIYKSKIYVDKIIEHLELIKQNSYPSYKYQLLIFLILIQFSDDKAIYVSMMNLNRLGFNLNIISEIHIEDLINLISSVKFNIKKANHIKNLTQEILQKFNGNPPETFYDILNLPGMELKLAQIYLNIISETNKKIIVTSHVHRISNR